MDINNLKNSMKLIKTNNKKIQKLQQEIENLENSFEDNINNIKLFILNNFENLEFKNITKSDLKIGLLYVAFRDIDLIQDENADIDDRLDEIFIRYVEEIYNFDDLYKAWCDNEWCRSGFEWNYLIEWIDNIYV